MNNIITKYLPDFKTLGSWYGLALEKYNYICSYGNYKAK